MCVEVTVCNISVVFLTHSVYAVCILHLFTAGSHWQLAWYELSPHGMQHYSGFTDTGLLSPNTTSNNIIYYSHCLTISPISQKLQYHQNCQMFFSLLYYSYYCSHSGSDISSTQPTATNLWVMLRRMFVIKLQQHNITTRYNITTRTKLSKPSFVNDL